MSSRQASEIMAWQHLDAERVEMQHRKAAKKARRGSRKSSSAPRSSKTGRGAFGGDDTTPRPESATDAAARRTPGEKTIWGKPKKRQR